MGDRNEWQSAQGETEQHAAYSMDQPKNLGKELGKTLTTPCSYKKYILHTHQNWLSTAIRMNMTMKPAKRKTNKLKVEVPKTTIPPEVG